MVSNHLYQEKSEKLIIKATDTKKERILIIKSIKIKKDQIKN